MPFGQVRSIHQRQRRCTGKILVASSLEDGVGWQVIDRKVPLVGVATDPVSIAVQGVAHHVRQRRLHLEPIAARAQRAVQHLDVDRGAAVIRPERLVHHVVGRVEHPIKARLAEVVAVQRIAGMRVHHVRRAVPVAVRRVGQLNQRTLRAGVVVVVPQLVVCFQIAAVV